MTTKPHLTLGPVLFNWPTDTWRDFYYRMADEAPVETVYIGEIVCAKRGRLFDKIMDDVVARLEAGGKKVVYSALALAMNDKSIAFIENTTSKTGMVEANDMTAVSFLTETDKPFIVGPYINTYNEGTMNSLIKQGAQRFVLPFELGKASIHTLAAHAMQKSVETEVMVYGRTPLAISAYCYHAHLYGREGHNCRFVCNEDPDGKEISTMTGQEFLVVNGKQTMSHSCANLVGNMDDMHQHGVSHFRLSPHSGDMVKVARIFKDVLDHKTSAEEALHHLENTGFDTPFANGYYHERPGHEWVG